MNDLQSLDRALRDGLRAIAGEDSALSASPATEAKVVAAFEEVARARARQQRTRWIAGALGAAAVVVGMVLGRFEVRRLSSREPNAQRGSDSRSQTSNATTTPAREVTTAFMPLAYGGVPVGDAHVVRLEVPRASLVSFGLVPADAADGARSGTVLADVIVGDDGLARAVRFVRRSDRKEPRR